MSESLNPMSRMPHEFEVDGLDSKIGNVVFYGTKICGKWQTILADKAKAEGMSTSHYIQKMVEEKFPLDMQLRLAETHGVSLAHQRRELFMHVWPDLPKWNVWSNRVYVQPNSPRRGRPVGSKTTKNTSHKPASNEAQAVETVNEPPMRNAYNDVMLEPNDYLTLREIAEARNVTPQQLLRDLAHKACANYRAAKAVEQQEDV